MTYKEITETQKNIFEIFYTNFNDLYNDIFGDINYDILDQNAIYRFGSRNLNKNISAVNWEVIINNIIAIYSNTFLTIKDNTTPGVFIYSTIDTKTINSNKNNNAQNTTNNTSSEKVFNDLEFVQDTATDTTANAETTETTETTETNTHTDKMTVEDREKIVNFATNTNVFLTVTEIIINNVTLKIY